MADIFSFVDNFTKRGLTEAIARNIEMQYGTIVAPFMLARYLPIQLQDVNVVEDTLGRIEGVFAAGDGDALSPPRIQTGGGGSELVVRLGHIDNATQMNARDMRRMGQLLNQTDEAPAIAFMTNWLMQHRLGLDLKAEIQRAAILCDGAVPVNYLNQPARTLNFPDLQPAGHRATVSSGTTGTPSGWYDDEYDPIVGDVLPMAERLRNKGFPLTAIIMSGVLDSVLSANTQVQQRAGSLTVVNVTNGNLQVRNDGVNLASTTAAAFTAAGLPAPMLYDRFYRTPTGRARIFPANKVLFLCETGRDQDLADAYVAGTGAERNVQPLEGVFGYYGVGVSDGQQTPGPVVTLAAKELKPVGLYAESYMEGFPVLLEPEGVGCLTVNPPT